MPASTATDGRHRPCCRDGLRKYPQPLRNSTRLPVGWTPAAAPVAEGQAIEPLARGRHDFRKLECRRQA
jgi:hypothetical protein